MLAHLTAAPEAPARVVILGGSGFIGTHLDRQLAGAGVARVSIGSRDIDLAHGGAPAALGAVLREDDTVVLLACATPERGDGPSLFMRNTAMAEHVGRAIEARGCAHVIHVGSDAVYPDDTVISDAAAPSPTSLYGLAHLAREEMLAHVAARIGAPLARLRLCAVFGPGDTHGAYGPNRFVRSALDDGRIELFGDGGDERDHVYVGDVCDLIARCASRRSSGVANVATGETHTFADVARSVIRAVGVPVEIVSRVRQRPVTRRPHDISALRQAFPEFSFLALDEGLRRTTQRAALAS